MISLAKAKVERRLEKFNYELEQMHQQRDLMLRLMTVREGSCADRWGTWGEHERFKDRPLK